jgi:hypothetical protein
LKIINDREKLALKEKRSSGSRDNRVIRLRSLHYLKFYSDAFFFATVSNFFFVKLFFINV